MAEELEVIMPEEIEVLACLFRSREFCGVAVTHLKATYFTNPIYHNMAKMAMDFYKRYSTPITTSAFGTELSKLVRDKKILTEDVPLYTKALKSVFDEDVSGWEHTLNEIITFIKNREWRRLVEEMVKKHLPRNDYAAIEKCATDIMAIKASTNVEALDYFSDAAIDERTARREEEAKRPCIGISTGIKRMDDHFPKNGWYIKELYVILAPPKRGKTMSLLWFANTAAWQGFNVAYFSCEVSKEVISDRCDAMNTSIEIKDVGLSSHISSIMTKMKARKPPGKLFIYEYPTKSLTSGEIEKQLKLMESKGTRIDIIFVDYGDIMKPMRQYDNPLKEEASIFEELRGIAGKFIIPVITATQVNREGSDKEIIKGKNIAGTYEKIMVADGIISLSATEAELKDGFMKIHFAECRNMSSKTLKIKTAYNFGRFYSSFEGEVL